MHARRVLVTGAGGFVGRATVPALVAAEYAVRAGVRRADVVVPDAETVPCDVTDPEAVSRAVAGCEGVVHLAALTRVRESFERPGDYARVNVDGTRTVLEAAAAEGARRGRPLAVVLMSTAAVYGAVAGRAVREDDEPAPTSPYARGKLAGDDAAAALAATGAIGAVSVRATNVAGPGDPDPTRLIPQLLAPRPRLTVSGDGLALREYTHVDDVADALVRALAACGPGRWRAFLAGSGVLSSVLDVVWAAERVTGRSVALEFTPPAGGPTAGRPTARPATASGCDSTRLRTELGWSAPRSDLHTILRDAWAGGPG